jgi:hypothetical protein
MKQKYEGKDLQSLVELGRLQGHLTFDQVNGFLPQDISSPSDLRSALQSFQEMDIKVLDDVPADRAEGEVEAEVEEEPDDDRLRRTSGGGCVFTLSVRHCTA